MSRSEAVNWLCAVVLSAAPPATAWARSGHHNQAPVRHGAQTQQERPESAVPQAAAQALAAGREEKGEGRLARAEVQFQNALAAAPRDSDVYQAALEELTYQLPLMRVQRYVLAGQTVKAGELLQDMLEQHQSDEKKSRHLVKLIAQLRKHQAGQSAVYDQSGNGLKAIKRVRQILGRFYDEHGRYPRGYGELNRVLPPDHYPLEDYDIVHYVERGHGYGLTLRSKTDPNNLLSVQSTGLVE